VKQQMLIVKHIHATDDKVKVKDVQDMDNDQHIPHLKDAAALQISKNKKIHSE
jgi:hypothetical protein